MNNTIHSSFNLTQSLQSLASLPVSGKLEQHSSSFNDLDCAFILGNKDLIGEILSLNPNQIDLNDGYKASQSFHQFQRVLKNCISETAATSLIHRLVLSGDCDTVSFFLQNSPYIYDFYPLYGISCFHLAALGNSTEMLELLLNHGFDLEAQDHWGRTPLHYSIANPNKEIFSKLIHYRANLNKQDTYCCSPLDFLYYQALQKSPLEISNAQLYLTLNLMISTLLSWIVKSESFQEWPILSRLASFLVPLSEFAFFIQDESLSHVEKAKRLALFVLTQQFTLTQAAATAYLLTQVALNTMSQLRTSWLFFNLLPYKALKLSTVHLTQVALLSLNFFKNYPLQSLKDGLTHLLMSPQYSTNYIIELTKKEWCDFSKNTWNLFEQIKKTLHQFN